MNDPTHPHIKLTRNDRRYRPEAYLFLLDALNFAQTELGMGTECPSDELDLSEAEFTAAEGASGKERHVSGQQLCEAIRIYAIEQFGLLAQNVLEHWGVRRTTDFGNMVFNMIDIGHMRKTQDDRREDFDDVYEFDVAFRQDFKISLPE